MQETPIQIQTKVNESILYKLTEVSLNGSINTYSMPYFTTISFRQISIRISEQTCKISLILVYFLGYIIERLDHML